MSEPTEAGSKSSVEDAVPAVLTAQSEPAGAVRELENRKLLAECEKLEAEAAQQRRVNQFWWAKWIAGGAAVAITLTSIIFGFAKDYWSVLQSTNMTLKIRNDDLVSKNVDLSEQRSKADLELKQLKIMLESAAEEAKLIQERELKASRDQLLRLQKDIADAGKNGTKIQKRLAELNAELRQAREINGKLEVSLQIAKSRLKALEANMTGNSGGVLIASKPSGGHSMLSQGVEEHSGWIVEVFPMSLEFSGQSKWVMTTYSSGSFVAKPYGFGLADHRKFLVTGIPVGYQASGYFIARDVGAYVFLVSLSQDGKKEVRDDWATCEVSLNIEGANVISESLKVGIGKEVVVSGGVELARPGGYMSKLAVACSTFNDCCETDEKLPGIQAILQRLAVRISVRAPGQRSPSELGDSNVVYVEK